MRKKLSLKSKIGIYLGVFTSVILVLMAVFQLILLEPMYHLNKLTEVQVAGEQISSVIDSGDTTGLTNAIYKVSAESDTCIRLLDGNTDIIAGNVGCILYRMSEHEITDKINQAYGNDFSYISNDREKYTETESITLTRLVNYNDKYIVVMVSSTLTPLNATIKTLKIQIVFIGLILLIAVLILMFVVNRNIARPLSIIAENAKELPVGKYTAADNTNAYQEAFQLNQTLIQAASDISKADRAKRDLIANVSHDLRTPLTMIGGYGQMMKDLPDEKTDENLQVIIDESMRLTNLVNDLLDLSKLQDNKISVNCCEFDLSAMIFRELRKYDVYQQVNGFTIETGIENDLMVFADPERIAQVFNNFMSNAINYSGDNKRIEIRAFKEDQKVLIEVEDHGKGIDHKELNDIWDRYYKIDKTHVRSLTSSGLGLAIVKEILELHHCEYGVRSEVSKGSIFWFKLPIVRK